MRKLKVLIGGNAVSSILLVEVVADVPVAELLPALINTFQLPLTDRYGRKLVYELRDVKSGQVIPPQYMLNEIGIQPAARLDIDVSGVEDANPGLSQPFFLQTDVAQSPFSQFPLTQAEQTLSGRSGTIPFNSSRTLVEDRMPALAPVPDIFNSSRTLADERMPVLAPAPNIFNSPLGVTDERMPVWKPAPNVLNSPLDLPDERIFALPPVKKKRGSSRRAFLLTLGAIGVVGAVGGVAAYSTYRTPIQKTLSNLIANHTTAPTSQVRKQTKPEAPTATVQNRIPLKQLPTAKPILTFTRHNDIVRSVAWSAGSHMLASGGDDKQVFVWGMDGVVHQKIAHPASVRALAWSPGGQRLVTGSGTQVAFFNSVTGAVLSRSTMQHTQLVTSLAWSPHGSMSVVSGSADKKAIIWNMSTYRATIVYRQHTAAIDAVAWSANGHDVASSSEGGFVRIWTAATGESVHGYYQDSTSPLMSLAFSPLGGQLAAGGNDGIVRLWNALTCGNVGVHCTDVPQRLTASSMAVQALAWSPDGHLLATGGRDGTFSIWDIAQNQKPLFSMKQNDSVNSLAWSPDGKYLVTASGKSVTVWQWM